MSLPLVVRRTAGVPNQDDVDEEKISRNIYMNLVLTVRHYYTKKNVQNVRIIFFLPLFYENPNRTIAN